MKRINSFHTINEITKQVLFTLLTVLMSLFSLRLYENFNLFSFDKFISVSSKKPEIEIDSKKVIKFENSKKYLHDISLDIRYLDGAEIVIYNLPNNHKSTNSINSIYSVKSLYSQESTPCIVSDSRIGEGFKWKTFTKKENISYYIKCEKIKHDNDKITLKIIENNNTNNIPLVLEAVGDKNSKIRVGNSIIINKNNESL